MNISRTLKSGNANGGAGGKIVIRLGYSPGQSMLLHLGDRFASIWRGDRKIYEDRCHKTASAVWRDLIKERHS